MIEAGGTRAIRVSDPPPFTLPITIVPAVAPETEFHSERPLFGRISAMRWYDQFYWPLALDQSPAGREGGYYDLLLADRNRDGDMADEGEVVPGRFSEDGESLTFPVGDLFFLDKRSPDQRFLATLAYHSQAGGVKKVEYRLDEWTGELTFSGTISIPDDALPGPATLVVNFSEMDEEFGLPTHFSQVARYGWQLNVMLYLDRPGTAPRTQAER